MTTPGDLDEHFRAAVAALEPVAIGAPDEPVRDGTGLTGQRAVELFEAQIASRHLDLAARWLRSFNEGYYTIGSSGHEGNAAVAAATRVDDPALLHYRSGAFYLARAATHDPADGASSAIRDVVRGLVASSLEPIAGGRHKVFGHADLGVVPTTSTIASHLPRAVGTAFAMGRSAALGMGTPWPADAIVVCSFGDASVNHATAQSGLNAAGWLGPEASGAPLPVLFVCEDNGLGISVPTPKGWTESVLRSRPGVRYFSADGCDLPAAYDAACAAADYVRTERRPAVLHLWVVRLLGHAGADAEIAYRPAADLTADLERDPLVRTATLLAAAGVLTPQEIIERYDRLGWLVRSIAEQVIGEPKLATAGEIVSTIAPRRSATVEQAVRLAAEQAGTAGVGGAGARAVAFGGKLPEANGPQTLAQAINSALTDALVTWPQALIFGEDVAAKGGVYGVTKGLADRFGTPRVFDTLLDETSILGLALGTGLSGMLPIPEIQYLAYLHNAEDQLRGEAATMRFFSRGAYRNPLVLRIAGLAYQEGFGGHFHNDNALSVLRDIPGLVVACPSRPDDAAALLRTLITSAVTDGTVCAFVEPIALYHTRDLYEDGDRGWLARYAAPSRWVDAHAPIGRARVDVLGTGTDLTIITFGNGVRMSLRAAATLERDGIGTRIVDLRWIAPLPVGDIIREAAATGRVLVVDETRRSGGVGEGVVSALVDGGYVGVVRRVASIDSYIPLGPAARHVLVSEEAILEGARGMLVR